MYADDPIVIGAKWLVSMRRRFKGLSDGWVEARSLNVLRIGDRRFWDNSGEIPVVISDGRDAFKSTCSVSCGPGRCASCPIARVESVSDALEASTRDCLLSDGS